MTNTDLFELRPLKLEELAHVITKQRNDHGWSQDTLAELAGLNVRTIQRVESAEPSTPQTRRSIARAFEWPDIDAYNKAWPFPNLEKLKTEQEHLERETVAVAVEQIKGGRALRQMAEQSESWMPSQIGDIGAEAEEVLAELQDYFTDYGDAHDCYSAIQKLSVNHDFQGMIDRLALLGVCLVAGTRRVKLHFNLPGPAEGMRLTVAYIIAAPANALPATIRVPRTGNLGL